MHLGGRKKVLYKAKLKLVLQETCVSAFCDIIYHIYMAKYVASGKCLQIPECYQIIHFWKLEFNGYLKV